MSNSNATPRRVRIELGIYRRASGRLEIGWRDATGKQRWETVNGGIKAARSLLAEKHAARARGERVAADPRLKLADAYTAWWEARVVKLAAGTQNAYAAGGRHLLAHFGRRRLSDVTATDVARYVTVKQTEGLKGWTIKGHLTVLSSLYRYAGRHLGFPGTNPVSLLDRIERPSSDDEKPKRILNADELERFLAGIDDDYRVMFDLAAETGLRLAEVLGLVWEDVCLDAQTIAVEHQLSRKTRERAKLKTKSSRRVLEVTPSLVSALRRHKLAVPRSGPHDFVFTTRAGTPHDHRNIGGRVLSRAVTRAGLEAVDRGSVVVVPAPTFHSLRHSHASALIASGWDVVDVSKRLGHSSVATTLRVYAHQFDAAHRSDDRRSKLAAIYGAPTVRRQMG